MISVNATVIPLWVDDALDSTSTTNCTETMTTQPISQVDSQSIIRLQQQAAALLLYQDVLAHPTAQAWLEVLQALSQPQLAPIQCLQAYGQWFRTLVAEGQTWQRYLLTAILTADNPFSRQAQQRDLAHLSDALVQAVQHDLKQLQAIYQCDTAQIAAWIQQTGQVEINPIRITVDPVAQAALDHQLDAAQAALRQKFEQTADWTSLVIDLAQHYAQYGIGKFARYRAFRWQSGELVGVGHPDPVQLSELVGYEIAQAELVKNTEFLLNGDPALHVLLYGSRGSGKSSRVKALVNEYCDRGLRLIEVSKSDLQDLGQIVEQIRDAPQKFIIFVDDLSFEDDDDAFKALKVVLEGSVTARPRNVVVYATSNRRHLVREFFDDRPRPSQADEINAWDTVQEKLSFGDRFGLTLTFEPADQATYLQIVQHLAEQAGLSLAPDDLRHRALQWATRHNGRSGRTARQFVDFMLGEQNQHHTKSN